MSASADFDDRELEARFPDIHARRGIRSALFEIEHLFVRPGPVHADDLALELARRPASALLADVTMQGPTIFANTPMPPLVGLSVFSLPVPSRDLPPFGTCLHPGGSPVGRLRDRVLRSLMPSVPFFLLQRKVNAIRADRGLPPLRTNFLVAGYGWHDRVVQGTVPGFEYPRSDLPEHIQFVGPFLPEPATDFNPPEWWHRLGGQDKVVLVTQGTFVRDPSMLIGPALQALQGEPFLVVVAGVPASELPDPMPANAVAEEFVPFDRLLPHVDAFVTNGGYGGVQHSLANGVPMVVAGRTEEKGETAARVAWSGVGVDLKTESPAPEQIRSAVRSVLSTPRFAQAAGELASEMASCDAAMETVQVLESFGRRTSMRTRSSA